LIFSQPISGRDITNAEDNFRQPVFWQTPSYVYNSINLVTDIRKDSERTKSGKRP